MESYELFCQHMERYEAGERELNEEEKEYQQRLKASGMAFAPLAFDTFLEQMKRYEAGERELNEEEKKWQEHLASGGVAFKPLAFTRFLYYIEMYNNEKTSNKHI